MITKQEDSVGYLKSLEIKGGPGSGVRGHRTARNESAHGVSNAAGTASGKITGKLTTEEFNKYIDKLTANTTQIDKYTYNKADDTHNFSGVNYGDAHMPFALMKQGFNRVGVTAFNFGIYKDPHGSRVVIQTIDRGRYSGMKKVTGAIKSATLDALKDVKAEMRT